MGAAEPAGAVALIGEETADGGIPRPEAARRIRQKHRQEGNRDLLHLNQR